MPSFNYKHPRFARIIKLSGGEKIFTFPTLADDYLYEYKKIVFLDIGADDYYKIAAAPEDND